MESRSRAPACAENGFAAASNDNQIVAGGARTVFVTGGWLQGVGLSFSSRQYGVGIDNVSTIDAVLANGTQVRADACTYLFWAIRGGGAGGGTFGLVTQIHYKLHPKTEVVCVNWGKLGTPPSADGINQLIKE